MFSAQVMSAKGLQKQSDMEVKHFSDERRSNDTIKHVNCATDAELNSAQESQKTDCDKYLQTFCEDERRLVYHGAIDRLAENSIQSVKNSKQELNIVEPMESPEISPPLMVKLRNKYNSPRKQASNSRDSRAKETLAYMAATALDYTLKQSSKKQMNCSQGKKRKQRSDQGSPPVMQKTRGSIGAKNRDLNVLIKSFTSNNNGVAGGKAQERIQRGTKQRSRDYNNNNPVV